ncbi:MAG TPA: hypothetical protein VFU71_21180 [Burkholderiaceae bacterium]|nr:hypothetical protein [Burkholderiaceae bacterium]
MRSPTTRCALRLAVPLAGMASLCALAQTTAVPDASPAERLLFMQPHLANIRPPGTLRYAYVEEGTAAGSVNNAMTLELRADAGGACCDVGGSFSSGPRALRLPDIEQARSNPALLYYLEHEIRQLQQETGGQSAHFRRRIRLALAERATMSATTIRWRGQDAAAQKVHIAPYVDDPYRERFEETSKKEYDFVMSDAVPGGVYQVLTQVPGTARRGTLTLQETSDARSPAR